MRKIYLEELPRKRHGLKCKVDWSKTIGHKCLFVYQDIEGEVEILDYNKKLVIKIDNHCDYYEINTDKFSMCQFGKPLNRRSGNFRFEIGRIIKDKTRDLVITDKKYQNNGKQDVKYYKYICNKCGYSDGWIREGELNSGSGCPVCCVPTRKVVKGINDIATTAPHLIKYLKNKDDAYKYSYASNKKITTKCPDCFFEKTIQVNGLYAQVFSCNNCSDGFSYPEKFVVSFLKQLNINFEPQKTFKWNKGKRYDFYLPEHNCIIETHGEQHYSESTGIYKGKLKTEQENDKYKEEMAIHNNIKNYIVLDCRKSEFKWVKNSIINSQLPVLLNFKEEDVEWLDCHVVGLKNIIKEVCEYKNKNKYLSTQLISVEFCISQATVIDYLKKGSVLGWCKYNPKEEVGNKIAPKSIKVFRDGVDVGNFKSYTDLEKQSEKLFGLKIRNQQVSRVVKGEIRQYKGFTFELL